MEMFKMSNSELLKMSQPIHKNKKRINKDIYNIIHHNIYYIQGGQNRNIEVDKMTISEMDKMTISEMDKMTTPIPNNKK